MHVIRFDIPVIVRETYIAITSVFMSELVPSEKNLILSENSLKVKIPRY